MSAVEPMAPTGGSVVEYDRRNLALYAALLQADDAGTCWREAATSIMHLDVTEPDAEACWRSHVERARWIVGDGMASALVAFSVRPGQRKNS